MMLVIGRYIIITLRPIGVALLVYHRTSSAHEEWPSLPLRPWQRQNALQNKVRCYGEPSDEVRLNLRKANVFKRMPAVATAVKSFTNMATVDMAMGSLTIMATVAMSMENLTDMAAVAMAIERWKSGTNMAAAMVMERSNNLIVI